MNGLAAAVPQPPALTAVRLGVAFLLLSIGPELLWRALLLSGIATPAGEGPRIEVYMAGFLVIALAIGAFTCWQPASTWRPAATGLLLRTFPPLLLLWTMFLIAYLQTMHALGAAVSLQPVLAYFAANDSAHAGFWIVVAATVLAVPVAEEIVFRGYLHRLLRHGLTAWPAMLASAVLFGLAHGAAYALPIGLLGLYFAWLRERSGSLLPSTLAHAAHNGIFVFVTSCWPRHLDLLYPR